MKYIEININGKSSGKERVSRLNQEAIAQGKLLVSTSTDRRVYIKRRTFINTIVSRYGKQNWSVDRIAKKYEEMAQIQRKV